MRTIMLSITLLVCTLFFQNVHANDNPAIIGMEISDSARTYYDLQSNGSSFMIEQNPVNPSFIHAIFTVSTDPGPGYNTRNARYFYSTNGGASWDYVGTVSQTRAGLPVLSYTSDNRAIVAVNSSDGGVLGFKLFVDAAPGIGAWTVLAPPVLYIGGNAVTDRSTNKVFITASGYTNVCTSLTPPGTFLGYSTIPENDFNSTAIGIGTGKTGVAYLTTNGSVKLIESTNSGVTWGAPQTIRDWNATDSTGALRGIDITYQGSAPQVVFELCKRDPSSAGYMPKSPSKILFWSPVINGGVPVTVDSAGGLNGSNPINDVFTSLARPVIGKSGGNELAVGYCKARQDTNGAGNNYYDIYYVCTVDGGISWGSPVRLTNLPGQFGDMHDCRYVSVSDLNANNELHFVCQMDSIPGSNVNGAASSFAKMYYIKVSPPGGRGLTCEPNGVINTGNEIPVSFTIKQNYPNPFNPVTQIEFSLPVRSHAKLTIYNALGEAVAVILNDQLSVGNYKVDWDASAFPSGVYFYELKTEGFTETRKMVFVK